MAHINTFVDKSLTEPPPPRFRYDIRTGEWRKDQAPTPGASSTASRRVVMLASDTPSSSFDFFLRKSYMTERDGERAAAAAVQTRAATSKRIADFERRRQQWVPGDDAASREAFGSPLSRRQPTSAALSESSAAELLRRIKGTSNNPLFGFIVGTSLPAIAEALFYVAHAAEPQTYASVAATAPAPRKSAGAAIPALDLSAIRVQPLPISFTDFAAFLSLVGPYHLFSDGYVRDSMFRALPFYVPATDTVCGNMLFAYIADNTYHPPLDTTVAMLFKGFDPTARGAILAANLRATCVREWAEKNTFGLLRLEWMQFAAALELEDASGGDSDAPPPPNKWMTREMVLTVICCSPRLYQVANSVDLEGSTLRTKHQ